MNIFSFINKEKRNKILFSITFNLFVLQSFNKPLQVLKSVVIYIFLLI